MLGRVITFALIAFIVPLLTGGAISRSKRLKKNPNSVYMPDFMLVLGIIAFVFFGALAGWAAYDKAPFWVIAIFAVFILLGTALIMAWKNSYILYDEEGFTYSTFFGRKRRYTYDQITSYKGDPSSDIILYAGKKRLSIDKMAMNGIDFFATVMEAHDGQLPMKHGKLNPTEQSVAGLGEIIVVLSLLLAMTAGCAIFMTCKAFEPIGASNCEKQKIVFEKYTIEDGDLSFYPEEGDCYILEDYAAYITDIGEIKKLCRDKKRFTVYSQHYAPDDEEPYNFICELSYKDEVFFSFEDANKQNTKNAIPIVSIFWGLVLMVVLMMVGCVVAGRNPQKHPILAKMLFKKSELIFVDDDEYPDYSSEDDTD